VTFEGVKWWGYFNGGMYMIPDLRSSRGKSTTSEIGYYPGHLGERLTGGTQRTTGLMVRYEVDMVRLSKHGGILWQIWHWTWHVKSPIVVVKVYCDRTSRYHQKSKPRYKTRERHNEICHSTPHQCQVAWPFCRVRWPFPRSSARRWTVAHFVFQTGIALASSTIIRHPPCPSPAACQLWDTLVDTASSGSKRCGTVWRRTISLYFRVGRKLLASSPNIDRFSKYFHFSQALCLKICNNVVTKYTTTP